MFIQNTTNPHPLIIAVTLAAITIAIKAFIANFVGMCIPEKKLIGGSPTEDRFENLIPLRAKKVALVGQNLASKLDAKYELTLNGIRMLLSRRGNAEEPVLSEFWLIFQTPLALLSTHPTAARHLKSITINALKRLSSDLAEDANRVFVAFHPAATLSMIVVDWHKENRLAVITPKIQTLPMIDRRFSLVLSGEEFDTVVPHFDRFLFEAIHREFPGTAYASLREASVVLEQMFEDDVVKYVNKYVVAWENQIARK